MPRRKITTKIEDNKVIFSQEVLEYYKNIRTEENSEWIDKYFEVLMKDENKIATKFRKHHIVPCLAFKNETYTNRKQTQPLADVMERNIIKLTISNHINAHYCLWKIFNNWDSKMAVQKLCKMENIKDLTDGEINEIARIEEECAKENQTKEERKEYHKNYYIENKDSMLERVNEWTKEHSEQNKKNKDEWYQRNKNDILQKRKDNRLKYSEKEKNYRHNHQDKIKERKNRPCKDPVKNDICTWSILKHRKSRNQELYKNVKLSDFLIKDLMIIPQSNA